MRRVLGTLPPFIRARPPIFEWAFKLTMTLAPPICRRKSCTKVAKARGLCKHHYDEGRAAEKKARQRALRKLEGEVPSNGLGILRCAVCNQKMSLHSPGQSCRGGLMERI